jgi:membrane fusion protein, multidrug efflux system
MSFNLSENTDRGGDRSINDMRQKLDPQSDGVSPNVDQSSVRRPARGRTLLVIIMLACLASASFWWLHSSATSPQPHHRGGGDTPTVVRVAAATRSDVPVSLEGLGTVTSLSMVVVKSQISGKFTEVGFEEGQYVKKGDFLAQIDPRPYQAALDLALGQLSRDQALLAAAKVDLARYEKLETQDSIARQQVDTQRALVLQDEAIVRSDNAGVDNATLNLNYCRIVAPSEGRVGLRLVDPGNYVQASDSGGIVVITQTRPISVVFTLPQDTIPQFISKLRSGTALPVLAYDRSGSTLLATGTLSTIDNQIDTTTGTVKLRGNFSNDQETLFPNQFVNAKLVVETLHDATVIPSAAVQIGSPGPYVYLANPDDTVSMRPVKLGPNDGERVAVLEGLSQGDNVVTDGVDRLKDGAKIKVSEPKDGDTPTASIPKRHGKIASQPPGEK